MAYSVPDIPKYKNPPRGVVGHRLYPSWVKPDQRKQLSSPDHDAIAARAFGRHLPVHRTSFARTPENDRKHLEALGEYVESRGSLKPGTIKKAIEFVSKSPIEAHGVKGMKSTPWRKTFKTPEHLDKWADANQAEVHATREIEKGIIKPDLKPTLKPEAKEALKDWYRNVYKKGGKSLGYTGFKNKVEYDAYVKDHKNMDKPLSKAFRYTCGNCGHSDAVHTIGGHPQPTKWGCAKCHADTKDIKPITEASVPRGNFKTEPVFSEAEKKKVKETGGFFKGFGPPRDVQRQEAMDRRMERINKKPVGGITFGGGATDPRAKIDTKKAEPQFKWPNAKKPAEKSKSEQWREWAAERIKDADAGKFKKADDKCPKCGGRMSQGAPHVGGNVKQNECHGCGHIEVSSRG